VRASVSTIITQRVSPAFSDLCEDDRDRRARRDPAAHREKGKRSAEGLGGGEESEARGEGE